MIVDCVLTQIWKDICQLFCQDNFNPMLQQSFFYKVFIFVHTYLQYTILFYKFVEYFHVKKYWSSSSSFDCLFS